MPRSRCRRRCRAWRLPARRGSPRARCAWGCRRASVGPLVLAGSVLSERAGEDDRRHHGAGDRVRLLSSVNVERFEAFLRPSCPAVSTRPGWIRTSADEREQRQGLHAAECGLFARRVRETAPRGVRGASRRASCPRRAEDGHRAVGARPPPRAVPRRTSRSAAPHPWTGVEERGREREEIVGDRRGGSPRAVSGAQ